MKKLFFYLVFVLATQSAFGQWVDGNNLITFDPVDSYYYGYPATVDTYWNNAIIIDTIHYHHNLWQVGRPQKSLFDSAYSLPNAIVTDTLYPYPPNDTSVFILTFPGHLVDHWWFQFLTFEYKLDIDSFTLAKFEYSQDSGLSWVNLSDSTPYGFSPIFAPISNSPGWHSIGLDTWMESDGPYYRNDSLKFRFTLISGGDTSSKSGWMIDNIFVDYGFEKMLNIQNKNTFKIYPNPANDILMISGKENIHDVSITNLLGQVIYDGVFDAVDAKISVSVLQPGLYFVQVNGTNEVTFIKE